MEVDSSTLPATSHFVDSGYTVVHKSSNGFLLSFNHGPLGMPPLYNHGHADSLSFTLRVQGRPVFVDPGTYAYNAEPVYRAYFRSTRAHNTVCIDEQDQAVQSGRFAWTRPYTSRVEWFERSEESLVIRAYHDGYMRLKSPVVHHRTLLLDLQQRLLFILDTFRGSGSHQYDLHFHLHPQAEIYRESKTWQIEHQGARVSMKISGQNEAKTIRGQARPPLGWFSPDYGMKVPSCTLVATQNGPPNHVAFKTRIQWV